MPPANAQTLLKHFFSELVTLCSCIDYTDYDVLSTFLRRNAGPVTDLST
jgi:hypothetical protein